MSDSDAIWGFWCYGCNYKSDRVPMSIFHLPTQRSEWKWKKLSLIRISMYRFLPYLWLCDPIFQKKSIEISLYSIVDPNTGLETEQNVLSTKNITQCVSEHSSSRDLSMSTVVSVFLYFFWLGIRKVMTIVVLRAAGLCDLCDTYWYIVLLVYGGCWSQSNRFITEISVTNFDQFQSG